MRNMGILEPNLVMKRAIVAGFCFHAYQQVGLGIPSTLKEQVVCGSNATCFFLYSLQHQWPYLCSPDICNHDSQKQNDGTV